MKKMLLACSVFSILCFSPPAVADDECDLACESAKTVNDGADDMAKDKSWIEEKIINTFTDKNRDENPELDD